MSGDKWSDEDFAKMKLIERAVIDTLLPLIQGISPLLAFYALIRCARVMLRKGDREAQKAILPIVFGYLEGRTQAPGSSPLVWVPPSSGNLN